MQKYLSIVAEKVEMKSMYASAVWSDVNHGLHDTRYRTYSG